MKEPTWLRDDVVYSIHRRQIAEHGGADGIRDEGLLVSAVGRPRNLLAYDEAHADPAALAASYAYGIIKNHPFVDGNKRVAFVACRTFLLLNGYDVDVEQSEKYLTFLRIAEGRASEEELAAWIRRHLREL